VLLVHLDMEPTSCPLAQMSPAINYFQKNQKWTKLANRVNQKKFNQLVSLWIRLSLRSFSIFEDQLLKDVITFSASVSGKLTLLSQNMTQTNVMHEVS